MKQPITMRCNEYQFNEIKEKLKGKVNLTMLSAFNSNERFYLINHLCEEQNTVTNVVNPIKREGVVFYEEWNEKIFLEACGIETEKTFSITESQIKKLEETETIYEKDSLLHRLFPEAFESEVKLEVGKWYKDTEYPEWKLFITNLDPSLKKVKCFGFCADGSWMENALEDNWDYYEFEKCIEMSEQEVFEALKNEAVKRGFKEGVFIKGMDDNSELELKGEFSIIPENLKFKCKGVTVCEFTDNNGSDIDIFRGGKWAEIIPTITKEEAEQQLGKKIIV